MKEKPPVDAVLGPWRGEAHPEPETLLAYHEGDLAADERDAVQEHVVSCAACTGFVLELVRSESPGPPADPEIERALAATFERIGAAPGVVAAGSEMRPSTRRRRLLPAMLALAGFALALFSVAQVIRRGAWREPNADSEAVPADPAERHGFEVVDLQPTERGNGVEAVPVAGGAPVVLVLHHPVPDPPAAYRAELRRPTTGELVWVWRDVQPTSAGSFTVELAAGEAAPGRYRIGLLRLDDGVPVPEARFEVELVDPQA